MCDIMLTAYKITDEIPGEGSFVQNDALVLRQQAAVTLRVKK